MEIKGKIHCFFEQTGTFKNEFKKMGYEAFDYDIQNNFNNTDFIIDLFNEIEKAYNNQLSIFDEMNKNDLIIAFFPCIYFTGSSNPLFFNGKLSQFKKLNKIKIINIILDRNKRRNYFYEILLKFVSVVYEKNLRMIFENPWDNSLHFLKNNFIKEPDIWDKNRLLRGDFFSKPTGFWFFNCEPTHNENFQFDKEQKKIRQQPKGIKQGICSEKRSMISSDYARNFIYDFIIGKNQSLSIQKRFDLNY